MQKIELIPVEKLQEHPDNPRLIKSGKFKDLCESVKRNLDYFETRPILCSPIQSKAFGSIDHLPGIAYYQIFAGTMRFRAAKEIGMTEVPCVVMDISDERQREIMVRDNQSSGEWDVQKLALFGEPLLIDAGFTKVELHDKFALFREAEDDGFDAEAARDAIESPKSQRGEVYELGRHRVMCGDSTNAEDVGKLMGPDLASVIFTDPPYNVDYSYDKYDGIGAHRNRKFKDNGHIFNDDKTPEAFYEFLLAVFKNAYQYSKDETPIYVCHATKTYRQFIAAFEDAGFHWSQNIIWLKERLILAMGQDYHRIYEPIMYGWKEGKKHNANHAMTNTTEFWDLDHLEFMERLDVWKVQRDNAADYRHPTQKPVKLIEIPLRKSLQPDGIVLDLFGGGGTTLIGAEQMGGSARLMELDPAYCDVIRQRWDAYCQSHPDAGQTLENVA